LVENMLEIQNVSKKFRLYHEKRSSIYDVVISSFNKKKHYEELQVLKDVSFTVKPGEMVGVLGKNGAGKTTLLRIIAGIYKPDTGKIVRNGTLIPFFSLGTGFQLELTARANILLYGILLGMSRKQIMEKVDEIIKFAELEKFEDTKLKNFSAGMYSRLAFSTAMQVDPDIILMDEIISVGDLSFQQKSYDTFLDFKKQGKSIILVTHSMDPVKTYCDRAVFLNNGIIESIGSPETVVEAYTKASFPS